MENNNEVNVVEQNKAPEKKKGNGLVAVVIILLVLALLGAVGYIAYDKGWILSDKKETNESNENNKSKGSNETKTSSTKENKYSYDDLEKEITSYESLFTGINDLSEISKKDLYTLVFNNIYSRKKENITLDDFNKEYKKTIFNNIELEPQDIAFDTMCENLILYKYNTTSKTFEYQELPGHDCGFGYYPVVANTKLYDYEVKDNKYVITKYIMFSYPNPGENDNNNMRKYYLTYEDAKNERNELFKKDNTTDPFKKSYSSDYDINQVISKLQKAVYTFEDKDGVLTLTDYKLVK